MRIHTSSEGVSLARSLESKSAQFYEKVARQDLDALERFAAFPAENQRNARDIERTYYGVITDAIEGGYCLDLDSEAYAFDSEPEESSSLKSRLRQAATIEKKISSFYSDAAEQMSTLMADLTPLFQRLAKKHRGRMDELEKLLES